MREPRTGTATHQIPQQMAREEVAWDGFLFPGYGRSNVKFTIKAIEPTDLLPSRLVCAHPDDASAEAIVTALSAEPEPHPR